MIIAVDVDGVIVDLVTPWLRRYNLDYNDDLTPESIQDWEVDKFVKIECGERIYKYIENPDIYYEALPIKDSLWGVNILRSIGIRVVFLTVSANGTQGRKFKWLYDNSFFMNDSNPLDNYIECKDKSLIRADILLDDGVHNIKSFIGKGVLFTQPWNRKYLSEFEYVVDDWKDFIDGISRSTLLY